MSNGSGGDDDFERRLKAARAQYDATHNPDRSKDGAPKTPWQGAAYAMRIGSELVAALIVGVGIGWLLDRWLGTGPWLMVLFFFLGGAAGVMNVYRLVEGKDAAVGWKRPTDPSEGSGRDDDENKSG